MLDGPSPGLAGCAHASRRGRWYSLPGEGHGSGEHLTSRQDGSTTTGKQRKPYLADFKGGPVSVWRSVSSSVYPSGS